MTNRASELAKKIAYASFPLGCNCERYVIAYPDLQDPKCGRCRLERDIEQAINKAVAEEREACARVAVDEAWVGTDMKYPKGKYQTEVAGNIATAIRKRLMGET